MAKNYMDKASRKGKMTNIPLGQTGFQSGGKLTKKGQNYKNDLLDSDYTDQRATRRKTKGM